MRYFCVESTNVKRFQQKKDPFWEHFTWKPHKQIEWKYGVISDSAVKMENDRWESKTTFCWLGDDELIHCGALVSSKRAIDQR